MLVKGILLMMILVVPVSIQQLRKYTVAVIIRTILYHQLFCLRFLFCVSVCYDTTTSTTNTSNTYNTTNSTSNTIKFSPSYKQSNFV